MVDRIIISVSIDATVRKWSLDPKDLLQAKTELERPYEESNLDVPKVSMLTTEEERELAELFQDD